MPDEAGMWHLGRPQGAAHRGGLAVGAPAPAAALGVISGTFPTPPSPSLSILFYLLLLFYFQDKNHLTNTKWPLAAMSSCYECLGSLATITPVCRGPDLLFTSTNILEKDAA